jgi:hypothetical protein
MGEKGKGLSWSHWMGLSKCLKPMHTLFEHTLLHVQVFVHDIIKLMTVEKDSKPFPKISKNLEHGP